MSDLILPKSPSPSTHGYSLSRRSMLKGSAAAGALAVGGPALLAACGDDDDSSGAFELGSASGDLSLGHRSDKIKE